VANVVVAVATQGSLQHVWSSISSLQMIVHLPMYNVTLPANAMIVFENLINVVTFDIISFKEDFGLTLVNTSPTLAFNDNFDTLGYGSQNTLDLLGSINLMIIWVLAEIVIYCLLKPCNSDQRFGQSFSDPFYIAKIIIGLMLQTILELLICPMATLLPGESHSLQDAAEWTAGDRLVIVYSYGLLAACTLFLIVVLWFLLSKSHQLSTLKRQYLRQQLKQELLQIYKSSHADHMVCLRESIIDQTVNTALQRAVPEEKNEEQAESKPNQKTAVKTQSVGIWTNFKDRLGKCRKKKSEDAEKEAELDPVL